MKNDSFIRHIDALGRVIIPKPIRQAANIFEEEVEIYFNADTQEIILKRLEDSYREANE